MSGKKERFLCLLILIVLGVFIFLCIHFENTPFRLIGAAFCHQITERSPSAAFPFCYRCSGIFMGIFFGLLTIILRGKTESLPRKKELLLFLAAFLIFLIDAFNSSVWMNSRFYPDQVRTRVLSAFPMGFLLGFLVGKTAFWLMEWEKPFPQFNGLPAAAVFPVSWGFSFLLIFSGINLLIGLSGLICCAGAVIILTILYTTLVKSICLLLKQDCPAKQALLTGALIALSQICLLGGLHARYRPLFDQYFSYMMMSSLRQHRRTFSPSGNSCSFRIWMETVSSIRSVIL